MRGAGDRDPLANLEIDPLRPLNNLLWGYIQARSTGSPCGGAPSNTTTTTA